MATHSDHTDQKPFKNARPALSHLQPEQQSPRTPPRFTPSAFSSPSASYRGEEENVVFEFGARHFSAGLAGESSPRCRLGFGPEESRRVGDYRQWLPGYEQRHRNKRPGYEWGEDHELWRMDIRELDLGLVEDKVERVVREAYSKYLLLDSKSRRLILLIPSIIPHPLLSTLLNTLFLNFLNPSITLLPVPLVCVLAAGCRSGLVVDIGWNETIVTGICEYREVSHYRTTRAMKTVTREIAKILQFHNTRPSGVSLDKFDLEDRLVDPFMNRLFEYSEEITTRMAWCQSVDEARKSKQSQDFLPQLHHLPVAKDIVMNITTEKVAEMEDDPLMSIPAPILPHQFLQIPFSHFARPVEKSLVSKPIIRQETDDHEEPLHLLIYKTLLSLSPDVRSICMSRIIFTGGGSNIPGLKSRLLEEVSQLVQDRKWDPVYGRAADERRKRLKEISNNRRGASPSPKDSQQSAALPHELATKIPPQAADHIENTPQEDRAKDSKLSPSGIIRGVETLGAWAGGSLLAGLKIKGIVEIDRDSFLQHGLAGAKRDYEFSVTSQRQSHGAGLPRSGVGEKTGWTLGTWA